MKYSKVYMSAVFCAIGAALLSLPAHAADWKPVRPINLIVPWAAGGSTDQVTRATAAELEPVLGQKIVIINQPGASGSIGTKSALDAPKDGYTWTAGAAQDLGAYETLGLLATRITDWNLFLNVANVQVISVNANSPYKTVKELLDEIDWGYHSERIENLTTLRNEITGLLTPRSDTRVKLYIRDKHIDLKAVNYENVSAYCANKGNDHPNRINLAKAWNNSGGREDKQFIDTNAIHNDDKKADTKSSAAPKSSAGGAAGGNVKGKPAPAPKGTAKGVDSSNLAAGAGGNLNPMASSYGQSVPPKKKVPQRARAAGAQAPAKNPLLLRPHH